MDAVVDEHDLVVVSPELCDVLGRLLEPRGDGLGLEIRRRQLDHAEAVGAELV